MSRIPAHSHRPRRDSGVIDRSEHSSRQIRICAAVDRSMANKSRLFGLTGTRWGVGRPGRTGSHLARPGRGQHRSADGELKAHITRKAARTETGGHWAFGEAWQEPHFDSPPRVHDEAEAFYVLEGLHTPPGAVHGFGPVLTEGDCCAFGRRP